MPFCPECGKDVSGDASFCPACGATVASSAGGGMPPPQPPPPLAGLPMGAQQPHAQPPAGAPPAYAPGVAPPPPVRKSGSGWKVAIIVGLIAILVLTAGGVLFAVFVFRAVKAPVDVTNRYIEAINDGDAEEAWDLLHPESPFKDEYTFTTFESDVVDMTISLRTWNADEAEVSGSRATVGVDMEDTSGDVFRISFDLRKDGGDWKVYDYVYIGD
jgi:hypothetical protein